MKTKEESVVFLLSVMVMRYVFSSNQKKDFDTHFSYGGTAKTTLTKTN